MDAKKVNQIKRQLERRGYKRYTQNLVGNEDYAYMKTTRNADGALKYIISHGFYDWEDDEGALENHGTCPWCQRNRNRQKRITKIRINELLKDYENGK